MRIALIAAAGLLLALSPTVASCEEVTFAMSGIEDRLAAGFSRDFYGALYAGVSPPEALARTQRAWILSSGGGSEQMLMRRRVAAWAYAIYSR